MTPQAGQVSAAELALLAFGERGARRTPTAVAILTIWSLATEAGFLPAQGLGLSEDRQRALLLAETARAGMVVLAPSALAGNGGRSDLVDDCLLAACHLYLLVEPGEQLTAAGVSLRNCLALWGAKQCGLLAVLDSGARNDRRVHDAVTKAAATKRWWRPRASEIVRARRAVVPEEPRARLADHVRQALAASPAPADAAERGRTWPTANAIARALARGDLD